MLFILNNSHWLTQQKVLFVDDQIDFTIIFYTKCYFIFIQFLPFDTIRNSETDYIKTSTIIQTKRLQLKMAFANKALAETIDVNIQSLSLIYNETFGLSYSLKQHQIWRLNSYHDCYYFYIQKLKPLIKNHAN